MQATSCYWYNSAMLHDVCYCNLHNNVIRPWLIVQIQSFPLSSKTEDVSATQIWLGASLVILLNLSVN